MDNKYCQFIERELREIRDLILINHFSTQKQVNKLKKSINDLAMNIRRSAALPAVK